MSEAFAVLMSKIAPYITPIISQFTEGLKVYSNWINQLSSSKDELGDLTGKLGGINKEIKELTERLAESKKGVNLNNLFDKASETKEIEERLKSLREEYQKTHDKIENLKSAKKEESTKVESPEVVAIDRWCCVKYRKQQMLQ